MTDIKTNRELSNYNYGETVTPFAQSGQEFDMPIGNYRARARFWRIVTLWFCFASVLFLAILIMEARTPMRHVVVVQFNAKGDLLSTGLLQKTPLTGKLRKQIDEVIHGKKQ